MSLRKKLSRILGLEEKLAHLESGTLAPSFSLKTYTGIQQQLTALLEQGPLVMAFFKISCPVCQFTFPFLQRMHERVSKGSASVIGVSQDDARETKDFCQEYGVKFPVLLDDSGYPVSNAYGLTNVPTIFLINPDGKIKLECMGFDKAALEKMTADLEARANLPSTPLFRPDEVVPTYKPG
jgi:peroxiredoxin